METHFASIPLVVSLSGAKRIRRHSRFDFGSVFFLVSREDRRVEEVVGEDSFRFSTLSGHP
ncbi:MAG: hypothetical protein HKN87_19410 [Saprospiraceae bacterium]|nr:hypothetical protein [Saprospiraceae bacterium]